MTVTVPHALTVGISIGGGIGPVRVSKRIGGGKGSGGSFLAWLFALAIAWGVLAWPYMAWHSWAAEIVWLAIVVGLPVAWFVVAVTRDLLYYRKHKARRPRKRLLPANW